MIHRFEVRAKDPTSDPTARKAAKQAHALGISPSAVHAARVYLVEAKLTEAQLATLTTSLFADPVLETCTRGAPPSRSAMQTVEVHPLPGVMDPVAQTVRTAVAEITGVDELRVSTGWRYDFSGISSEQAHDVASGALANATVDAVHTGPFCPESFPTLAPADQSVVHVPIRELDEDALIRMSREDHLFLSLDEMWAIQMHYRAIDREPTDIELETLAQTWSEHCVHKTLKSTVRYTCAGDDTIDWADRPGVEVQPDGSVIINNLLKSTVAAATHELIAEGVDWTRSVFVDNAGIIDFDEDNAVCVKVETHNHPSAIEPYGGAATGIGGVHPRHHGHRARRQTDREHGCVLCGAPRYRHESTFPRGASPGAYADARDRRRARLRQPHGHSYAQRRRVLRRSVHREPARVLRVRRHHAGGQDLGRREARRSDRRAGRADQGATASTGRRSPPPSSPTTHADEFSHAVQIGNAIEEKRTLDAILRARDARGRVSVFTRSPTAARAGSRARSGRWARRSARRSSSIERRSSTTACATTRSGSPRARSAWSSPSPKASSRRCSAICDEEHVELSLCWAVFGTDAKNNRELMLNYRGEEVGRISMALLHDGIPDADARGPLAQPAWSRSMDQRSAPALDHADIKHAAQGCSRIPTSLPSAGSSSSTTTRCRGTRWSSRWSGRAAIGPGDAAVIQPVAGSKRGSRSRAALHDIPSATRSSAAIRTSWRSPRVDECVRNLVCVGADPERIAILDNFCWPSCNEA